ncbi:MAG: helix-turn-helix domain-containing protein [Thermoguttaceae bacterium]|jgi:HTH-type transcriptional regulator/antitoxin HigA|nr:helix-turn-helix domain-containing protein [Thermoguttaceae bacterium]
MEETKYYSGEPDYAVAPGEILLDLLEDRGVSQVEFARLIDLSENEVEAIVNGETELSYEVARKIEQALDVPASTLMNLEESWQKYRQKKEEEQEAPVESEELLLVDA